MERALIGVVLPNLAYAVNAEIIRGAERRALAGGYPVLIADAAGAGPTGAAYQRLVLEGRVDGLLVASTLVGGIPPATSMPKLPLPVVYVNRLSFCGVSVSVDDARGVALASSLIELGHSEHALRRLFSSGQRAAAAGRLLKAQAHGLVVRKNWMIETELSESGGFEAMQRLLAARRETTSSQQALHRLEAARLTQLRLDHPVLPHYQAMRLQPRHEAGPPPPRGIHVSRAADVGEIRVSELDEMVYRECDSARVIDETLTPGRCPRRFT